MRMVPLEQLGGALLRQGPAPRVVAAGNQAAPLELLRAIDSTFETWRLFMLNAPLGIPNRSGVRLETSFVGPGMRDQANLDYLPARLSLVPSLLSSMWLPDIVVLHTSPPGDGRVSLGCEVNILPAVVETVRARGGVVVAQINPDMPYTFGDGELAEDAIDLGVEVPGPLTDTAAVDPASLTVEIGARVAALVPDGATIQLGIGGVPDAVAAALASHRELRVWSEMFSDGVLALERAGRLDGQWPISASFCIGSADLYAWLHRNERVRMQRTENCNDPGAISGQRQMTSINSALEVDLFGQANAQWRGGRIYSGFGGQTDFIVGALHSPGGQAVIALPSWHARADCSTIVGALAGPVTSFQHSHVVTEQGVADIVGSSQRDQCLQLINECAHPDARAELNAAARLAGLLG